MPTSTARPAAWTVTASAIGSVSAMVAAVYFGGQGELPIAMTGTLLFVILGGLAFDLARRRSA